MVQQKFRVAVCGGGIGGLTCAIALSKYPDIQVDIYESAAQFTELGAGVGIWPRPWRVMESLGLADDLLATTQVKPRPGPVPVINYRKADQAQGLSFYTLMAGGVLLTFHRPDFQRVLLSHLPSSCGLHCSKRLRSYSQNPSGTIELVFQDGTKATCDVLIGADGVKSAVRKAMLLGKSQQEWSKGNDYEARQLLSAVDPHWCGTIAYRALIPGEKLKAYAPNHRAITAPTQYLGKNAHIMAYPISHGKMINVAAFSSRHHLENTPYNGPWVSTAEKEEFLGVFANWEPEVQVLLQSIDKATKWSIHTVKPMESYVSSRVVLIGDAAHGCQPSQGSGAGQAIEDAYLLATLLGHPRTTLLNIRRTLEIYDSIRRPFANEMAERARWNTQYFTFHHGVNFDNYSGQQLWFKLQELGQAFTKNWEWAWSTTLDGSVREAVEMLECS